MLSIANMNLKFHVITIFTWSYINYFIMNYLLDKDQVDNTRLVGF